MRPELVPLVDPERPTNYRDVEDCAEILLNEGWTWEQVGNWAREVFLLQPPLLRLRLGRRRN